MVVSIKLNYVACSVDAGTTVGDVCREFKPDGDVVLCNGVPALPDRRLAAGDEVLVFRRAHAPSRAEMEAAFIARHGSSVHEKVKDATVGIAGVGGLGSNVAVALTRLGVGRFVMADDDIVEPSNLNRQHYFIDQLGAPKVEALAQTLRRINPYVAVDAHRVRLDGDNVPRLFAGCNVLVEAFDRADAKEMLITSALAELPDTYIVGGSGVAGYGPVDDIRTCKNPV